MRVGLIGLGIMGSRMGANLLAKGQHLTVWNRTASRTAALASRGAEVADSIAALTRASDVVLVCVSDTPDVEAVMRGGVIEALGTGKVVVDHSTISPSATVALAAEVAATGAAFLDAPVSGGAEGAARGTLSIMVGGNQADFDECLPAMKTMGASVVLCGEIGAGNVTKLANQIVVGANIAAVAEALVMATKAGVNPDLVFQAIRGGLAGSTVMNAKAPMMIDRNFKPGFRINLYFSYLSSQGIGEIGIPLSGLRV